MLVAAKKRAAELRTTLKELFERGLRRELDQPSERPAAQARIRWVTAPGGLPEGLDVADREQLHRVIARRQ